MPTHVLVNGIGLTHKGSIGISIATLPDVCKTPSPGGPVPIPYPNTANHSSLAKGTKTVRVKRNMIATKPSEYSRSTGDEPGTAGGVKSSTFMKEATWITYSFDVKFEGENACRHTDKMFHNHQNTVSFSNTDGAPPSPTVKIDCGERRRSGDWPDDCCVEEFCAMVKKRNSLQEKGKLKRRTPSPSNYLNGKWGKKNGWSEARRKAHNKKNYRYQGGLDKWTNRFNELVATEGADSSKVANKFVAQCRYEDWKKKGSPTPISRERSDPHSMSPDHEHDVGLGGPISGQRLQSGLKWVNSRVNRDLGTSLQSFEPSTHTGEITTHASCNCS